MPLDETRQRLAAAIEKCAVAAASLDRINRAIAVSPQPWDLTGEVEQAEEALKAARVREPETVIAKALNEAMGNDPLPAAEKRLAEAQRVLEEAREVKAILASSAEGAQKKLDFEQMQVRSAIAAVLAASPELAAMISDWRAANARVATLHAAISAAFNAAPGSRDNGWDAPPMNGWPADAALANAWREAVEALQTDPAAPLPAAP